MAISNLGLGLLGAAQGVGQLLTDEYGRINEEKADIRDENRAEARLIEQENRAEERQLEKEARDKERQIEKERRDFGYDTSKQTNQYRLSDENAAEAERRRVLAQEKKEKRQQEIAVQQRGQILDLQLADDARRQALGIPKTQTKASVDVHLGRPAAKAALDRSITSVTGQSRSQWDEDGGDEILKGFENDENTSLITALESAENPEAKLDEISDALTYRILDERETDYELLVAGKKLTSEDQVIEHTAAARADAEALVNQAVATLDRYRGQPPENWLSRDIAETAGKSRGERIKFFESRAKEDLASVSNLDPTSDAFRAIWKPYLRDFRSYMSGE
jgi:hypothetical protein